MYYHVVGVGSRVVFRKKPAEIPHPQHDSIGKTQVYQGFDEQTGQAILFVFFTGYSNVERIGLLRLERIVFCGGGCPACLISTYFLSCSDNLAHLFYMLDHKKIGTFSEFLHKMKRAIAYLSAMTPKKPLSLLLDERPKGYLLLIFYPIRQEKSRNISRLTPLFSALLPLRQYKDVK